MRVANCKTVFIAVSLLFLCVNSVEFNRFEYGVRIKPHPKKVHKGGEDALFANNRVLSVADGVSFWNKKNIDPSKYSKELCRLVGLLVKEGNRTLINNPKEMIKQVVEKNTNLGTSTLVIASLDRAKPLMRTAYVGDSTYVIYRKQQGVWTLIFESEGQQHSFNYPFQLGYKSATHPNKAAEFVHEVQDKDIVVVASDGIFDNMTSEQVLAELLKFIGEDDELKNLKEAAYNLTEVAFKLSIDRKYNSPFAQKSAIEGKNFKGGKSDDITAVVGQVRLANVINITKTVVPEESKEETAEPLQVSEIIKRVGLVALIGVALTLVMVKKSLDLKKKTTAEKIR